MIDKLSINFMQLSSFSQLVLAMKELIINVTLERIEDIKITS